jgi:hypothetical protein
VRIIAVERDATCEDSRPVWEEWPMQLNKRFPLNAVESLIVFAMLLIVAGPARGEDARLKQFWLDFRAVNPFHVQAIVASTESHDGERMLLITEPPPHFANPEVASFNVRLNRELANVFGDALAAHDVFSHPVGYDGWVKDIAVRLHYPAMDNQVFEADILRLHRRLFGTTYKATVQIFQKKVPANPSAARKLGPPNLQVNAAALNDWLFGRQINFVRIGQAPMLKTGTATLDRGHLRELFEKNSWGLFQSESTGLVVILIPRLKVKLNEFIPELRKFVLDTDAILGVVAWGESQLAIIGRERDSSLTSVPPLRIESILTLAATRENELGQSFERRVLFAGKSMDDLRDWAPIYLSQDLRNTEVGSLLNITDQILKSWSESGFIEYERFPYLAPARFPTSQGVSLNLETTSLTYNWNTVGLGHRMKFAGYEILALERTGSLPVSYIPEGKAETADAKPLRAVQDFEDTFWNFFSERRDPNLSRAVQYAGLYMAFRTYPVAATRVEPVAPGYQKRLDPIKNSVKRAILQIQKSNTPNLMEEVEKRDVCKIERVSEAKVIFAESQLAKMRLGLQQALVFDPRHIERLTTALVEPRALIPPSGQIAPIENEVRRVFAPASLDQISRRLNGLSPQMREHVLDFVALYSANEYEKAVELMADCGKIRDELVNSSRSFQRAYIKTPTIVVSWDNRLIGLFRRGGHNLYSTTTKVLPDLSVPKGRIVLGANGELRLNPADAASSAKIAREYQRNITQANLRSPEGKAQLMRRLEDTLKSAPATVQDMTVALKRDPVAGSGRGLTSKLLSPETRMIGDPEIRTAVSEMAVVQQRAAAEGADVILTRTPDGVFQVHCPGCRPPVSVRTGSRVNAHSEAASFAELAAAQKPARQGSVVVYSDASFSRAEMEAFRLSADTAQAAAGGGGRGGGFRRTFFSAEPANGGGGIGKESGGRGNAKSLWYMGRDNSRSPWSLLSVSSKDSAEARKLLARTDAKWSEARVTEIKATDMEGGTTQVNHRVEIPFEQRSNALIEFLSSFKRSPEPDQVNSLTQVIAHELEKRPVADGTLADRLIEIRSQFIHRLGTDAQLEMRLQDGIDDIFIVESDLDHEQS